MKVVNNLDPLASGICQKPLLTSNLENIVAQASKAKVSSTLEREWTSRRKFSSSFFKSQSRKFLLSRDYKITY